MNIWDEIIHTAARESDKKNNEEVSKKCIEIGAVCPLCGKAHLLYDGKLNLICPACGFESSAGFT